MRKTMLVAAAALIGSFGIAAAADLGGYRGSMKDAGEPAIYPTWGGFYVGGTLGYGWGDVSDKITATLSNGEDSISESAKNTDDINGAVYGAHLGYNFQRGNIVFGPEIGINGTTMDGSTFGGGIDHDVNWYATAVGRLGYASGQYLFYGFGGVAWGEVRTNFFGEKDESTQVGWTAGVGVEYALSDRVTLRLEYSHVDLGSDTTFKASATDGELTATLKNETDVDFDVVKAGVNFKFGHREESLK